MGVRDLTTLANVKAYLGITTADSDAVLTRLITAMSYAFVQEIGREILRTSYTEIFDGNDERIKMRAVPSAWLGPGLGFAFNLNSPVIGDPAIVVDDVAVPKRTGTTGSGWVLLFGYRLELVDFQFTNAVGNIKITYEAGQYVPAEAATIPANPGPYTIQAQQAIGTFLSDVGVTYAATALPLTKVSGTPAVGQYSVSSPGLYTFAAADQGLAVFLAYAHLPTDIEDCVIEMVAYKFNKRPRLDQISASIGGQSVFFTRDAWPITVQEVIERWRRPIV